MRECSRGRPDHLSAYALTLDEGSLWHAAGVGGLPGEDDGHRAVLGPRPPRRARPASSTTRSPTTRGPAAAPRHNQLYWRSEEYLALGPGACGFLGDVRYGNVKPVERYCALVEAGALPVGDATRC